MTDVLHGDSNEIYAMLRQLMDIIDVTKTIVNRGSHCSFSLTLFQILKLISA